MVYDNYSVFATIVKKKSSTISLGADLSVQGTGLNTVGTYSRWDLLLFANASSISSGPKIFPVTNVEFNRNSDYTEVLESPTDGITNISDAPNATFEWYLEPDTSTVGEHSAIILATNPNGYRTYANLRYTVTPVEDQATLVVKDSTIYVGTPWTAADNFISATDSDGNAIDLADVTVSGTVDTTTPGEYEVTYSYGGLTQIATITVVEEKPANPTPPVVPTQPTIPGVPGETPVAPSKPTELKTDYTSDLPQAGEKRMETALLSLLGVGLTLATALFLGFGKRRKHEENKT